MVNLIKENQTGEGKEAYKGNKSDMSLGQHGGEGRSLAGKQSVNLTPARSINTNYTGMGRNLKTEN